jgi:large conductance mechanosensitive channel
VINGFKEFILRGNVVDLAVAVVIGAAFTAIVNVIVTSLINPLIALVFNASTISGALAFPVQTWSGEVVTFSFGAILGAIINFLAVAVVVYFAFVYPMNRIKARAAEKAGVTAAAAQPQLPTEQELLVQIRDLLEKQNGVSPKL